MQSAIHSCVPDQKLLATLERLLGLNLIERDSFEGMQQLIVFCDNNNELICSTIERHVLKFSDDELDATRRQRLNTISHIEDGSELDLNEEQQFLFNLYRQALLGLGESQFSLSEYYDEGKNLLSYKTLYDYDYDDFLYQERQVDKNSKHQKTYKLRCGIGIWFRAFWEGEFTYGTICKPSQHIKWALENLNFVEQLIPYKFVAGPEHEKITQDGILWDMVHDANGLENELELLLKIDRSYINETFDRLDSCKKLEELPVIVINESKLSDPNLSVIVSNEKLAKEIRFLNFEQDVKRNMSNKDTAFFSIVEKEIADYRDFMKKQYQDLLKLK